MKNAVILHGLPTQDEYYSQKLPSMSNCHWLPWLQKQLMNHDIKADTPEVPKSYEHKWQDWVREVERFEIGPETLLVGHSCGGGFWIKYLSLNKNLKVGKVVLVAPWLDPDGDEAPGFFDGFEIDPELTKRTKGTTIFHSDNDMGNVHKSVAEIREKAGEINYREFHNYGHFCYQDMGTVEFPELLSECLKGNN
jgi:predicted alpha/beta hydrolase family esterase